MKMKNLVFLCTHKGTVDTLKKPNELENEHYPEFNDSGNKKKKNFQMIMQDKPNKKSYCSQQENEIDTRLFEQDLGSDGECIPSYDNSPPSSPQLLEHKRRESAPAKLNFETMKEGYINDEKKRSSHRRYSSVGEQTGRVRYSLEESFKEEEVRFGKQFNQGDLQRKFCDIIDNKSSSTQHLRQVPSPPCLSVENKENEGLNMESYQRSRKCSVYSNQSGFREIQTGQVINNITPEKTINRQKDVKKVVHQRKSSNKKMNMDDFKVKHTERKYDSRKLSLQEYSSQKKYVSVEDKANETSRKLSLQVANRKFSFSDRKFSLQERKASSTENEYILNDRKFSNHERKVSSNERKHSSAESKPTVQENRKTSFGETIRSVVNVKKKSERKLSNEVTYDENNNIDKKTAWGVIKNKMKKDRKSSNDTIKNGSPQMLRLISRNDSSSSLDSVTPRKNRRSDLHRKPSQRSEDLDRHSTCSFNSTDDTENSSVSRYSFDMWCEAKVHIDMDSPSLPLLHVASAEGNKELLKTLIDVGVDVNELDQCGWPALHYAICSGHFNCAQFLLAKGALLENYSNKVMNSYCTTVRECMRREILQSSLPR